MTLPGRKPRDRAENQGVTVSVAVLLAPFFVAARVTVELAVTLLVVTVARPLWLPAGMVIVEGTVAMLV